MSPFTQLLLLDEGIILAAAVVAVSGFLKIELKRPGRRVQPAQPVPPAAAPAVQHSAGPTRM